MKSGLAALAAWMVLGCGGGSNSAGQSGDLAVVDGEPISMAEFHRFLEVKPTVKVYDANGRPVVANIAGTFGYQGMDDLIRQKVVRHIAKDEGVYPTDKDVADELEFQKKLNPNYLKQATQSGLTIEQIKDQLSLQLAVQNIMTKGITVTPDEIDSYIKENPSQFVEPATADLDWIVVNTEDEKKQVDSELATGQRFAEVAMRHSKAENARVLQGKFPVRAVNKFSPGLRALIDKTAVSKSTDWQNNNGLWAKWYVEKKTPEKPIPIDDTKREEVRRAIAMQRGKAAIDLDKKVNDKLRASKIEIKKNEYKSSWDTEMQALAPAPAITPTTPAATPTTTPAPAAAGK